MENMRNEAEKELPFQIGETIFATDDIFDKGRLMVKRNTQGCIASRDTIHGWRVVFEEGASSLGVNSADISHGKVSKDVNISEEVDRRNDYQ